MKECLLVILTIILSFVFSIINYAEKVNTDLANNIFRLHIVANSNSEYDQNIKMKLKDDMLKYLSTQNLNFNNIDETIKYFNNNIDNLKIVTENSLNQNQYNLDYSICIDKSYFPTKSYNDISLPSGEYNCLKIKLGKSSGKNWWCVLYPNLCSTDLSISNNSKNNLKSSLSKESYNIITNNISYKFKIVELVENIKNSIKTN